jgi:hypothetical protein
VIATPSSEYANISTDVFCADGRKRTILDCWRILSPAISNVADVIYLGKRTADNAPVKDLRLIAT